MKDEIKEILNDLHQWVDNPLDEIDKKYGIWELSYNQSKLLLDCITNLQEEYEKEHYLVDKLTRQLNDEYKNTEYQCKQKEVYKSRNKKAIDCINHYAVENEDYSKIYNDEEKDLLNILQGDDKDVKD